jgi:hypothetical protein
MKGGAKITFAGGSMGNGDALAPQVIANKSLTEEMVSNAPCGTVLVGDPPARMEAEFTITKSGGMEVDSNVAYLEKIVQPALRCKKREREGILGVDGFGSHHSVKVLRKAQEIGLKIALRAPHMSRLIQGPDTDNFPIFARLFDTAKSDKQVAKFRAARAYAAGKQPPRKPTAQELYDASTLTEGEWLTWAVTPWEKAFDPEVNRRAWKNEGIVPFTRKVMWDLRAVEQKQKKEVAPVSYSESFFNAFGISKEQAAAVASAGAGASSSAAQLVTRTEEEEDDLDLSSEGMNADAEAALEAEANDGPKKKKPRVSPSDLFKLKGSASGRFALQIIREKEVERRVAELKKEANKDKRAEKAAQQRREDVLACNKLLNSVCEAADPAGALLKSNKDPLASLLRIHGEKPPENKNWQSWAKGDMLQAVRTLLQQDGVGSPEQRPKLIAAAAAVPLLLTLAPPAAPSAIAGLPHTVAFE